MKTALKIAMAHVDLPNETKGGVAAQAHLLANVLSDRGHEVTMFTFSPAYADCRYRVHQYPLRKQARRFASFCLAACLARTDFSGFDVLHTHGDNYLLHGRHPQVRTFHGSARDEAASAQTWQRRVYQTLLIGLEQRGARAADRCTGVSEATRARIPAVSEIIPCGVDTLSFRPGVKTTHPTILFVGTTGGRKRGQFLADEFAREVRPRFPDAELWSVAEKPMAGDGILNFGRVDADTLADLFRRAWVFCLPSTYEGFGVPYIEAMASGTAVVASPNPGAREVLRGGTDGLIADDDQLGMVLVNLLRDPAKRHALEQSGPLRAGDFSWEQVAGKYEAVYADLIDSRTEAPPLSRAGL